MSNDSEDDIDELISGIEEGKQELFEMIESSEENTEEIKSEVEAMANIAVTMTKAHHDLRVKMRGLTEQLEQQTEERRERMEEFTEAMIGTDDSTVGIAAQLHNAKNKIENDESEEAQEILRQAREEIEAGRYGQTSSSNQALISRLKMAESDAKLSRTNTLDDILSDIEGESS